MCVRDVNTYIHLHKYCISTFLTLKKHRFLHIQAKTSSLIFVCMTVAYRK